MGESAAGKTLHVNGDRLWASIMDMAKIGATAKGGVCRVTGTDEDRDGRTLFTDWCESAGCSVTIDRVGNIFARRPGRDDTAPPIVMGSHLDSQPTGGKFDGVYGVLAGLEVIRTLNDNAVETQVPIEVAVWTNEEGVRFAPAMLGSGVFAGELDLGVALSQTDDDGCRLEDALSRIGFAGSEPAGGRRLGAHFEAHIEQGPILENEAKVIGIVTGVQGMKWFDVVLTGAETHAGPTPMSQRQDPVLAALPLLSRIYNLAFDKGPEARITIGQVQSHPHSRNTVPGSMGFSIDMRHPESRSLEEMANDLHSIVDDLSDEKVNVTVSEIWTSEPVAFDPNCVGAIRQGAEIYSYDAMDMVSGAGHDSVYLSRVAPTAMIFVPCKGGISHNELEEAQPDHLTAGCNVLLHAVLERAG